MSKRVPLLMGELVVTLGKIDLRKVAVLGEPIVGIESVSYDERGQGALPAKGPPSPKEPAQAARDRHNLTHLTFESWCPLCIACRRPNSHHKLLPDYSRTIPLLVGDCGFSGNSGDDTLVCVLVLQLHPNGILFACIVQKKGPKNISRSPCS